MKSTADWLDDLKAAYNLPSDYAIAKKLGITQSEITAARKGRRDLSERLCFAIAELLDVNGVVVWASIKAAKTDSLKMRKDWEEVAEKLAATA